MQTRLYRSRTNAIIGGVCGGLGEYLGIDPVLVRLFFFLLALGNGVGVLIYVILWIMVPYPEQGEVASAEAARSGAEEVAQRARGMAEEVQANLRTSNQQATLFIGAALVVLGLFFLLDNLNLPWLRWLDFDILWPILLIIGGAVLIWRRLKGG